MIGVVGSEAGAMTGVGGGPLGRGRVGVGPAIGVGDDEEGASGITGMCACCERLRGMERTDGG